MKTLVVLWPGNKKLVFRLSESIIYDQLIMIIVTFFLLPFVTLLASYTFTGFDVMKFSNSREYASEYAVKK